MWNDRNDAPSLNDDIAWSPEQMARLEGEWRRLQRAFAYHPHVSLIPLHGDPPCEYQVDYRLTTLVTDAAGVLDYATSASVRIWLPPGFPDQAPVVQPLTGLFHPNATDAGIFFTDDWHPAETLLKLVQRIGDILTYRMFDPEMVVNPQAWAWLEANPQSLPLDTTTNLSPSAGGEPLGRICRYGQQTLDAMRQSLEQMQQALLAFNAPDSAGVRDYTYKTRLALNLFLETDVPDHLRSVASNLDDCAREMADDVPLYDDLRARRASVSLLRHATNALNDAILPLGMELDQLSALVAEEPTEPLIALKMIPEPAVLQRFQLSLPKLIADGQRKVSAIRQQLDAIARLRPRIIASDTLLAQRLTTQFEIVTAEIEATSRDAADALGQFEPVLERARIDQPALERIARWRDYVEMISRARALERRVAQWGSDGVQAYHIENEGGLFGPFQFEQPVDLGGGDIVARSPGRGQIEVRDPATESVLGANTTGELKLDLAGPPEADGKPKLFTTAFRITERCDDLLVQLDFLRRQTSDMLQHMDPAPIAARIWCGRFCRLLELPEARKSLNKELSQIAYRWRQLMMDLAGLSPFKERVATYFLLQRVSDGAPSIVKAMRDARHRLKDSEHRLGEIAKKCSRDVDTDRLVIPAKLRKPYEDEMAARKQAGEIVKRSGEVLKSMSQQLTARLRDPKLLGKADVPQMRTMPALPEELATLPLTEGDLGERIEILEELLHIPLGGPRRASGPPAPKALVEGGFVSPPVREEANVEQDVIDGPPAEEDDSAAFAEVEPAEAPFTTSEMGPLDTPYAQQDYIETDEAQEEQLQEDMVFFDEPPVSPPAEPEQASTPTSKQADA